MNITTYMAGSKIEVRPNTCGLETFATITVQKHGDHLAGFTDITVSADELRQIVEQATAALVEMARHERETASAAGGA